MSQANPAQDIQSLKIGSVSYLNGKPLTFGIDDQIRFAVPSELASALRAGDLNCALVPIVEYFECPHYQILPVACIGSRGPVRSVYLAYQGALSGLKRVFLDPDSKTSSLLLQVILKEFFALEVEYSTFSAEQSSEDGARLLIGDPALLHWKEFQEGSWHLLDLGEVWFDCMNLPFVYATWLVREGIDPKPFVKILSRVRDMGREHLEQIICAEKRLPEKMVRSYFTQAMRYDFGAEQIKGILQFQRLLKKHGLIVEERELKFAM